MSDHVHFSADDFARYTSDEELTSEYLLWFDVKKEHLDECDLCLKRLHRYMLASSVAEDFDANALVKLNRTIHMEKVLERVKAVVTGFTNIAMEKVLGFTFTNRNYPALAFARGEDEKSQPYWIDWREDSLTVNMKAQKGQTYVIDLEKDDQGSLSYDTKLVKAQDDLISSTFERGTKDTKYRVQIFPIEKENEK